MARGGLTDPWNSFATLKKGGVCRAHCTLSRRNLSAPNRSRRNGGGRRTGRARASMRNLAIQAAIAAQTVRARRGRPRLFPTFTGRRINPRGRFRNVPRMQRYAGTIMNETNSRFQAITKAVNMDNRANPVVPVTTGDRNTEVLVSVVAPDDAFRILVAKPVNIADPELFPRCSAIANQYQNWRVRSLILRYVPQVSQAMDGTILFAFVPDPDCIAPTTVDEMQQLGGCVYDQVFGKPLSIDVSPNMQNTAYNKLTIHKPATSADIVPLNSAGKLFVAISGVNVTASTVLGTVYMDYDVQLMNPRRKTNANGLDGTFTIPAEGGASSVIVFSEADLDTGVSALVETATAGVYRLKVPSAPHVVGVHMVNGASAPNIVLPLGQRKGPLSPLSPRNGLSLMVS